VHEKSSEKVASVQFDPEGDVALILYCTEGTARFQVNSSIMCFMSLMFTVILGRNSYFKEARGLATRDSIGSPLEVPLFIFYLFKESLIAFILYRVWRWTAAPG